MVRGHPASPGGHAGRDAAAHPERGQEAELPRPVEFVVLDREKSARPGGRVAAAASSGDTGTEISPAVTRAT